MPLFFRVKEGKYWFCRRCTTRNILSLSSAIEKETYCLGLQCRISKILSPSVRYRQENASYVLRVESVTPVFITE